MMLLKYFCLTPFFFTGKESLKPRSTNSWKRSDLAVFELGCNALSGKCIKNRLQDCSSFKHSSIDVAGVRERGFLVIGDGEIPAYWRTENI